MKKLLLALTNFKLFRLKKAVLENTKLGREGGTPKECRKMRIS